MKTQFIKKAITFTTILLGLTISSCSSRMAKKTTYIMEAEYIYLDDVQGSGISSDQGGVEMIYGDGTDSQKALGWSNGYFVGYTYAADLKLDFKFTSSKIAVATLSLRLGSELGEITLNPSSFEIQLNGIELPYQALSLPFSSIESMQFVDKIATTRARLAEGENVISLIVRKNTLKAGTSTGGPCVDCIKLTTSAELTWVELLDNPSRRGAI